MNQLTKLPCTAFEELMLTQDSPAYPCNIYVRMKLCGQLDRHHFTDAVRLMIDLHPLLRAKLATRYGRSTWQIEDVSNAIVSWHRGASHEQMNTPEESQFDLLSGPGLRIDVVESCTSNPHATESQHTLVAFKLHHAVADGLGINAAIHDMWLAYDALVHGRPVTLPQRNSSDLPARNRFVSGLVNLLQLVPKQLVGLAGVRQYLLRQPSPMVKHEALDSDSFPALTFDAISYECSQELSESLRQEAKRRQLSLNDLLAACVFRGSAQFRASRGAQGTQDWLRMMVPISLRNSSELQRLPACNVVSSVFLDRTPAQIEDLDSLAQSIHEEMELIKGKRLALMLIFSLWIRKQTTFRSHKSPIGRCQTSMVFSNLGKIFLKSPLLDKAQRIAPGNATLESFEIFAPLTRFMCAAFTALIYGRRLKFMLRFDPRFMNAKDAQQLLNLVSSELERFKPAEALAS